jgi:gamma-glutamyl hercynylcysteine S-oxide synthase
MLVAEQNLAIRDQLLQRMSDARERSDALFQIVRPAAMYERPIPERHRLIFYLGHLEAFDWNLLRDRALGAKSFHPEFDRLFAFGIDPVGAGLPSDQPSDWPSLAAVQDYAKRIQASLDWELNHRIFESHSQTQDGVSLDTLLNVAIEHRLMHLETLAYMLHQLPFDKKVAEAIAPAVASSPVAHRMVEIPTGEATLGLSRDGETFGWDNEYERHTVTVPTFEIDQFMVTNRQYIEFMAAGGYETRSFWSDADWNWKTANEVSHPAFWRKSSERWLHRSMFEEVPLPMDWPVYVSHAEASAYSHWAGKSLPTEQEWHRAAYGTPNSDERDYPWGNEDPGPNLCNADFVRWDPVPVNALPSGQSAFGVHGMVGNGWEWTSTAFAPFPSFEPFPFYRGYSTDFFDGRHFVMKGGSARTSACMLRPTFRNWFQPHYQYVYAGFRCVSR